jgi:uncharacterized LabA/DUF88 family protein
MQDVYEDNFDIAYLVSGDSDLVAPVKKVLALDKSFSYFLKSFS